MSKLYQNVGKKIQILAVILSCLASIYGFIIGYQIGSLDFEEGGALFIALIIGSLGAIVSWALFLPLYGFGLLVEKNECTGSNDLHMASDNNLNLPKNEVDNGDKINTENEFIGDIELKESHESIDDTPDEDDMENFESFKGKVEKALDEIIFSPPGN